MRWPAVTRVAAYGAVVVTVGGGLAVGTSVAALPDAWTAYVSEAGIPPHPYATRYRLGVLLASTGLALLGAALARLPGPVWGPLAAGAWCGTVSALVPCSAGCPLPPYEPATAADLVHAGASALAVVAAAIAMLGLTFTAHGGALRDSGRIGLVVTAPQLVALGVAMLAVGRGATTSTLERTVLATVFAWMVWTAMSAARRPDPAE